MSDRGDPRTYFWPYDIFGYLLPGIIAVAPLLEFQSNLRELFKERYQADSIMDNLVLIVGVYVIGHLISAAASFLLERVLLRLTFGYPLGQFICGRFAGTAPRRFVLELTHAYRWRAVRWTNKPGFPGVPFRCFRAVCEFCERRLDLLPGPCHAYDPKITRLIQKRFAEHFGVEFRNWSVRRRVHEVYWTVWAFVAERMPMAYRSAMHFLEIYGFCRNSCLAFLLAATYPLCPGWSATSDSQTVIISSVSWSLACGVAALLMYINFTKLIRRQNDFMIRAFISYESSKSNPQTTRSA